ncbi:P-loop containing nucleoside triphosphate hydrolase protein [Pyronema omphalodes]|nr:P-loop containing nucleoside triphosphate hydrolase protein [Pyronema omphalodes]
MLKLQIVPLSRARLFSTRIPLTTALGSSKSLKQPIRLILSRQFRSSTHAYSIFKPAQLDLIEKTKSDPWKVKSQKQLFRLILSRQFRSSTHAYSIVEPAVARLNLIEKTKSDPGKVKAIKVLKETQDNLIIQACAGSGKTTLCLAMAASCPDKRFLLLVYNRHLRLDTKKRIDSLGLTNIAVYNYHSLGYDHYTPECSTDEGLKRVVGENRHPRTKLPSFDVLLLDEQQDMSPLFYQFVTKLLSDSGVTVDGNKSVRFVLVGDPAQEIYGYNGSSAYFLTKGDHMDVFGKLSDGKWQRVELKLSYRCTPQILKFINSQVLKASPDEAITSAVGDGPKPMYLIDSGWKSKRRIDSGLKQKRPEEPLDVIDFWINKKGLLPEDILILVPSVKAFHVSLLVNRISKKYRYLPIHVGYGETLASNRAITEGKLCVLSFHQSKGIERKAVLVMSFDDSYNKYYDRNPTTTERANNAMYVATTRALNHLVLVNGRDNNPLCFIDTITLPESCDVEGEIKSPATEENETPDSTQLPPPTIKATDLCRKVHEDTIKQCIAQIEIDEFSAAKDIVKVDFVSEPLRYPRLPKDRKIKEDYSGDVGTAFTAIYELISDTPVQHSAIEQLKKKALEEMQKLSTHRWIKKWRKNIEQQEYTSHTQMINLFIMAVILDARYSQFCHRIMSLSFPNCTKMIEKHKEDFCKMVHNLSTIIGTDPECHYYFEKPFFTECRYSAGHIEKGSGKVPVIGIPDIYTEFTNWNGTKEIVVYEIKMGSHFEPEHFLQLAIYCAMVKEKMEAAGNLDLRITGILVNPRTGQSINVTPKPTSSYRSVLEILVSDKYGDQTNRPSTMEEREFLGMASTGFPVPSPILPEWVNRDTMSKENPNAGRKRKPSTGAQASSRVPPELVNGSPKKVKNRKALGIKSVS